MKLPLLMNEKTRHAVDETLRGEHVHWHRVFANGIATLFCHFDGSPIDREELAARLAQLPPVRWPRVVRRWEAKHR